MTRRRSFTVAMLAMGLVAFAGDAARAQAPSRGECGPYVDAAAGGNAKAPAVIPDRLLLGPATAIPCLLSVIRGVSGEIAEARRISDSVFPRVLSATAALRTMMARATPSADQTSAASFGLNEFIRAFREADDLAVISVLAYGARSDSYDLRINAVLILGNVIDNTTVCVPLVHLNDPSLMESPNGANGRANLLGVVSVVAPWALRENFEAITRTVATIRSGVGDDSQLANTRNLLANIETRLGSQTETSNKGAWMDRDAREKCARYAAEFRPAVANPDNVRYAPH
jgi:hypothetical protein